MKFAGYRKCLGCGTKKDKKDFLRITAKDLTVDIMQNKFGRGMYVCLNKDCIKKALKRKSAINRYCIDEKLAEYENIRSKIYESAVDLIDYVYRVSPPLTKNGEQINGAKLLLLNNLDIDADLYVNIERINTDFLLPTEVKGCAVRDSRIADILLKIKPILLNFDGLL